MVFDKMAAITGGIGSGKTYISNIFQEFGIPVFNTDNCAKNIMNKDTRIISEFCSIFGNEIYKNGELDRKALGDIIFYDKKKLDYLEALVHPAVLKEFMDWKFEKIHKENYPFVMMENAILTKSKTHKLFDLVVFVDAPMSLREERIMSRPGMTKEKMEIVIKQQSGVTDVYLELISSGIKVYNIFNDGKDIKNRVKECVEIYKDYFKK
jgi:dephospho-CoA kinase